MVFLYSARLGLVVLAALLIYAILRLTFYRMFRRRSLDLVHARARENSTFIETARAIQSIKIFNRENGRNVLWSNRYADVMAANAGVERLKGGFKAINDVVFGVRKPRRDLPWRARRPGRAHDDRDAVRLRRV